MAVGGGVAEREVERILLPCEPEPESGTKPQLSLSLTAHLTFPEMGGCPGLSKGGAFRANIEASSDTP